MDILIKMNFVYAIRDTHIQMEIKQVVKNVLKVKFHQDKIII